MREGHVKVEWDSGGTAVCFEVGNIGALQMPWVHEYTTFRSATASQRPRPSTRETDKHFHFMFFLNRICLRNRLEILQVHRINMYAWNRKLLSNYSILVIVRNIPTNFLFNFHSISYKYPIQIPIQNKFHISHAQ